MNMGNRPYGGVAAALAAPVATSGQPFTWGQGGRRMTPEEIARERQIAARQMQSDYSPIASPWQGLARVADQLVGAFRDRDARRASDRNAAESASVADLLMRPPTTPAMEASGGAGAIAMPTLTDQQDQGVLVPGNLPTGVTQQVQNPDGSISTVRSMSFGTDQGEVLVPTVIDGRVVSDEEAMKHYYDTGQHLGIFASPEAATAYAQNLHNSHAEQLGLPTDGPPPVSEAPAPPSDWRQVVATDPVAAALVKGAEEQGRSERALAARPKSAQVIPPVYRPRDAIMAALTNPYVDQNVRGVAEKLWQQEYEQSKPQFFMSNDDRVMFDPVSGESQTLYDAPEDFQLYADQMGLEPGTDEYNGAMADYVLRASGPTAQAGREYLEGVRQQNRVDLEGVRQKNRMQLRSTPTYSQANPRPTSGRGGGSRSSTLAGVIAPILGKVAQGKPLTAGEQQALNTYYRRNGKPSQSGSVAPSAGEPTIVDKNGQKMVVRNGKWVPLK